MRKLSIFVVVLILALSVSVVLGQATTNNSESSGWMISSSATWGSLPPTNFSFKYGGTVSYMGQSGPVTLNFNPFSPTALAAVGEIYEPLFHSYTNPITPVLGVNYKWEDNNLKLIVKTRSNVEWSDGVPFTAKDVAFTFNLLKKYPVLDLNGIWSPTTDLQSVEASGTNLVIFTFSAPNVPFFPILVEQTIVPEHIWSKIDDPQTWTNPNPVGTGPFLFSTFDAANGITTLVRNPNYWLKGRPYIDKFVEVAITGSQAPALLKMLKGDLTAALMTMPNVYDEWVNKNPLTNKFIEPINGYEVLLFNTTKYPFSIPEFRKALALAINKSLCKQGAYGSARDVASVLAIPPSQQEWIDPTLTSLASSLNVYDPTRAQEMLASIGFKKNAQGQLCDPDGTPLPSYTLICVGGWADFTTMSNIISSELKTLGINATVSLETQASWYLALEKGLFDMSTCWDNGFGSTPYYMFDEMLNPQLSAPIGQVAVTNFTRYSNPIVTAALKIYQTSSDLRLQKQAIYTIERIFLDDMPYIPLTTSNSSYEFLEKDFIGWPSDSNPYGGWYEDDIMPMASLSVHLK